MVRRFAQKSTVRLSDSPPANDVGMEANACTTSSFLHPDDARGEVRTPNLQVRTYATGHASWEAERVGIETACIFAAHAIPLLFRNEALFATHKRQFHCRGTDRAACH